MNNLSTKTVKEIALENPPTIPVFQEFKIDFCRGGKRLFDKDCRVGGGEQEIVSEKLAKNYEIESRTEFVKNLAASELIDYIVRLLCSHISGSFRFWRFS